MKHSCRSAAMGGAVTWLLAAACGSGMPSAPGTPSPPAGTLAGLSLQGDPESAQGATWTYRDTMDGVAFDLQGILLKPRGAGPFPAVVISHGAGGNATGYSRAVATDMVQWGLVCIATNYTHAGGVPRGAPGGIIEAGASHANVLRAHAAYEILRSLGYVNMTRVAAHGHSMGAFVTTALVGAYPNDFLVASHTAGGVSAGGALIDAAAPIEQQARTIRAPYQMHHGDADTVVTLGLDQRLAGILLKVGVPYELHVYPGAEHNDLSRNPVVLARIRTWYATHGFSAQP